MKFHLTVEAIRTEEWHGVAAERRLARLLKALLRRYGFRVKMIERVPTSPARKEAA